MPSETSKIRHRVLPFLVGRGADLGCGGSHPEMPLDKVTPDAIGVDAQPGSDVTTDLERPLPFQDGEMDWLWSSHLLEHLWSWQLALEDWVRVLRPGGILGLYLPHADYYDNAWNSDHKHALRPDLVGHVLERLGMELLVVELDVDDVPLVQRPDRHIETARTSFLVIARKRA